MDAIDAAGLPSARVRAQAAQNAASDPAVSAFVSASAGSGKTKLLTDRLLRLMLGGADPARIQCLTYTKAAAAEMALRLQAVLGRWVTLDDAALDAALRTLEVMPDAAVRARARALFARVLDLPGGMRIGTIHAFCQSLLRRFPLEARISPHFALLEEAQERTTRRDAAEAVLGGVPPGQPGAEPAATRDGQIEALRAALRTLAGLVTLDRFDALVQGLIADRERLASLLARPIEDVVAAQRAALGATRDGAELLRDAVSWDEQNAVREALRVVADKGAETRKAAALRRLDWLTLAGEARIARWAEYERSFFTASGDRCSWKTIVGEALDKQEPGLRDVLCTEQDRVAVIRDAVAAARCAANSAALVTLALPMARLYAQRKQDAIRLDYADLIAATLDLLRQPGATWVLYKLDGGLDHLLLDEVQDTAPAQWRIAAALVEEFFAGAGARETPRTVFAVGDRKQSIFSFQGADPDGFETWRNRLGRRVQAAGGAWHDGRLDVSFRSTAPVLALVDAVFADPEAAAGVCADETLTHRSDRADQAGAVELWPLTPKPEADEPPPWAVPRERQTAKSAPQRLAEALAAWIAQQTSGGVALPSRGRALGPGDVLVLVRRRKASAFAASLVRCLKQKGVPVAGLDRMTLTEQPAVADLLALCDALLLPEDDLAAGCVLTSPLGGLDDDDLIALAPGRPGSLWQALHARRAERPGWERAAAFFSELFARVDYAAPHALLTEALGRLGGRARLLARLGPEAAEPIDELLAAALTYAQSEPPSLQGFLHWLRRAASEVKREAHGGDAEGGGMVRIMTVHGAKGLQAPLVILPDTTAMPRDEGAVVWAGAPGAEVPLWAPVAALGCDRLRALRDAATQRRIDEYHRLLYVALTRAEDRLVVCGWQVGKQVADGCWYQLVERGMARLSPERRATVEGDMLVHDSPQCAPPDRAGAPPRLAASIALPRWAGSAPSWSPLPPPAEAAVPQRLAPSRPADAALGAVPAAASPLSRAGGADARFRRGRVLHALLQHLPELAQPDRAAAAERFVSRPGGGLEPHEIAPALADVLAVLGDPALAPLFGPGSRAEVPLTGRIGDRIVGGLVDRLAVLPDRVLVADYKTARMPPSRPEDVPVLYLRQMAAYRAVLRLAFPGRAVECLLVWTTGARVMALPQALLDSHAPPSP